MKNIELKNFQEKAVDFLYDATTFKEEKKIIVHSPTGSGKTIILIAYIEKYLQTHDDTVFIWICPGKGDLEEQSKDKFIKFTNLDAEDLNGLLNQGFKKKTTYFFNWEKITGKDRIALQDTERNNFYDLVKKAHNNQYKIILIIDEEHQNDTNKANYLINAISAEYEIRVSATPVSRALGNFYQIDEIDVINEELITRGMHINYELDVKEVGTIANETDILIEKAVNLRTKIANEYKNRDIDLNPLVLIQFPNLNDELIEQVENKLSSFGYTYENKLLASWFTTNKKEEKSTRIGKINVENKDFIITQHNAKPCFLLFKQAIATGWDCPRAKILVKLRENMNENFEIQTLGRLRRMPFAKHYDNNLLDFSYLYTFDEKYKEAAINVGAFETQRVFIKDDAKKIILKKELRNLDSSDVDEQDIRKRLKEYFINKYNLTNDCNKNKTILEDNGYKFAEKIMSSYFVGKVTRLSELGNISYIDGVSENMAEYEVNTHLHGRDVMQSVDSIKKYLTSEYKSTRKILKSLFCENRFNRHNLLELDTKKFYAFILNNIKKLKEDLSNFNSQVYHQNLLIDYKTLEFKIPLEENYRFRRETKNIKNLDKNVYKEYNSSMTASPLRSMSERLFENYCENNKNVKFIYKNGDKGQEYLSIVYSMNNSKQCNFYPDYIVELINGDIYIIETKGGEKDGISKNIDTQVANKFNQFKRFAQNNDYKFAFVRDIDEQLFYNNTEYTEEMKNEHWKALEELF